MTLSKSGRFRAEASFQQPPPSSISSINLSYCSLSVASFIAAKHIALARAHHPRQPNPHSVCGSSLAQSTRGFVPWRLSDAGPACPSQHLARGFRYTQPRYLIRDRDCIYGAAVTHRLRTMGIRDKPIAPGSPWQNGFAERLIGSIRRECVDHVVVLGEAHLRRIPTKYAAYYNELRTDRSLNKDAPIPRAIQHAGRIICAPILGGLHHHYCRI